MTTLRNWLSERRAMMVKFAHAVEGLITIALIAMGAGASGYFFAQYQMRAFVLEERADHVAEIERLQRTYAETLAYLTTKASATADAAESAANESAKAATDSAKAAKRAVAPSQTAPTSISEAQRTDINRKIEAINRKVREKE